ncbi:MAG: heterodisulfide reductase-related iron-sulfur binding cluster [Candidatus Bathyarchaeia archaeon]
MRYDISGARLSEKSVKEALNLGAEIIATACPFCMLTLEDSIKTIGAEDKIQVKDIMELLSEAF